MSEDVITSALHTFVSIGGRFRVVSYFEMLMYYLYDRRRKICLFRIVMSMHLYDECQNVFFAGIFYFLVHCTGYGYCCCPGTLVFPVFPGNIDKSTFRNNVLLHGISCTIKQENSAFCPLFDSSVVSFSQIVVEIWF